MRNLLPFTICVLIACYLFGGCAVYKELKFVVEEGYIPAAKKSAKSDSVKVGVAVTVDQSNLNEIAGNRTIRFSGMTPGNKFMFHPRDKSLQERKVDSDGTFHFFYPKNKKKVEVFYGYTEFTGRWHNLDAQFDYNWDESSKTFKPIKL